MDSTQTSKKFPWWIIIILVVLIGGGIAAWYYKFSKNAISGGYTTPSPAVETSAAVSPSASPTSSKTTTSIKLFFIAPDDNGKTGKAVGCGDSIVGVNAEISPTQAVLKAAIDKLLSIKTANYGQSGLKNSLANSNLTLDSANIDNKIATLKLSGTINSSGTCDDPRIKAQLEETALQFPTVSSVKIFVNGKNIDQILSGRGQ